MSCCYVAVTMDTSYQQDSKSELKKLTGNPDGWPYSCTTTSASNFSAKTLIGYDIDETLDIKEEIIEDPGTITVHEGNESIESKFYTVYIKEEDSFEVEPKPPTIKKQKNQESKQEKKYTCNKCARTYSTLKSLKDHEKYVCGVMAQYSCKLCDKIFKHKGVLKTHVDRVHHKLVVVYKCDKCSRSYNWLNSLNRHKRVYHATVKKEEESNRKSNLVKHITSRHLQTEKQFLCDYCKYKSNRKSNLASHITLLHLQASKSRYKCEKCALSYKRLDTLTRHKRAVHSEVNEKFICDYCEFETTRKSVLARHIISRHLQAKKQFICNYYELESTRKSILARQIIPRHLQAKKQFICDYCEHKSFRKSKLASHITTHHLQDSKSRHKCEKCARLYNRLDSLTRHKRFVHALVKR